MSTTNNRTFASRAKSLINKYKNAAWDPIQKKELQDELAKLAAEQEQVRAANNMNSQLEFAKGGVISPFIPDVTDYDHTAAIADINNYSKDLGWMTQGPLTVNKPNIAVPDKLPYANLVPGSNVAPYSNSVAESQYTPYSTSIAPAIVSGVASLVGNTILANQAKKYTKVRPVTVAPEQVSYANERQRLAQEAAISQAATIQNARTAARTRGEYLGNVGAAMVGLNRNLGGAYGQSYQNEANTNAQLRMQAAQANTQNQMYANAVNAQTANQARQEQAAYQSAAIEAVPQMIGNINQLKQFDTMLQLNGGDYQLVKMLNPNRKNKFSPKYINKIVYNNSKS